MASWEEVVNDPSSVGIRGAESAGSPRIAIVMLTHNSREKTLRALESIRGAGDRVDVLVWDNGSVDDTADVVEERFPEVHVHRHPFNLGVASGRNAAARLATEELRPSHLLFLDNDMVVRRGFVTGLLDPFLHDPTIGQTQAKLLFMNEPTRINDGGGCDVRFWLGSTHPVGYGEIDRGQRDATAPCVSCGGAMMVRADLFEQLGGFDSTFDPYGPEDLDFSLRLQKLGFRALYAPAAVALHEASRSVEGGNRSADYTQRRIRHWVVFLRRHASPLEQLAFFTVGAPYRAVRLLSRHLWARNFGALAGALRGARDSTRFAGKGDGG
jgi:GT2 family glycosyltransferase